MALLELDDSLLVAIDVQAGFLARVDEDRAAAFIERAAWLVGVAVRLGVPVVATVENQRDWGGVHPALSEHLPPGTPVVNKTAFGLHDDPHVRSALEATGRSTAVLLGMETDVCVAQSAIGLLGSSFLPHVVADAATSPGAAHEHGLERLRGAGVPLLSVKGTFMEWVRTPDACRRFEHEHPELFADAPVLI